MRAELSESRRVLVDVASGQTVHRGKIVADTKSGRREPVDPRLVREVSTTIVPEQYNGKRPFHQSYSHYKYFGFAGQGAKTSYAHRDGLMSRTRDSLIARGSKSQTGAPGTHASGPKGGSSSIRHTSADLLSGREVQASTRGG